MKLKDYLFIIICSIGFGMALYTKKPLISIIGISFIYICVINSFIYSVLKWNKNKKQINTDYIKLKIDNFLYEFLFIFTLYLNIKSEYISRSIYLHLIHNKIVKINNFIDYINTYSGTEKITLYMLIALPIGIVISIIKKILLRGRISSDKILLSNGELINLKDIKNIKIENSFWEFSKKITFDLDKGSRIIYIKNNQFSQIEKHLNSLGLNE